jgi:hypothetical protein
LAAVLAAACAFAGCGKEQTLRCEPIERYSTARSSPPVQIPDDLSPPDESEALRLPPASAANSRAPTEPCLESPPAFFETGRPGGSSETSTDDGEPTEAPPPAANGDREITN